MMYVLAFSDIMVILFLCTTLISKVTHALIILKCLRF